MTVKDTLVLKDNFSFHFKIKQFLSTAFNSTKGTPEEREYWESGVWDHKELVEGVRSDQEGEEMEEYELHS